MDKDIMIIPNNAKASSYVVAGAKTTCSMGSSQGTLSLPKHYNVYVKSKRLMTTWDNAGITNIGPMGSCKAKKNSPCKPGFCMHWQNGNDQYLIEGERPALLKRSAIVCVNGGRVTIANNGQT